MVSDFGERAARTRGQLGGGLTPGTGADFNRSGGADWSGIPRACALRLPGEEQQAPGRQPGELRRRWLVRRPAGGQISARLARLTGRPAINNLNCCIRLSGIQTPPRTIGILEPLQCLRQKKRFANLRSLLQKGFVMRTVPRVLRNWWTNGAGHTLPQMMLLRSGLHCAMPSGSKAEVWTNSSAISVNGTVSVTQDDSPDHYPAPCRTRRRLHLRVDSGKKPTRCQGVVEFLRSSNTVTYRTG